MRTPQPLDAGRRGGVHHVVTAPVLPWIDADRAVLVAVVLPVPACRGILRRHTRSGSADRCPLAACDAALFADRATSRAGARVVRRLHPVRATGPGNRAVPVDPGAAARRDGRPVSGRHRLARRHPADTRPKEPSRGRAAVASRGGAGAGRLLERGAPGDRRAPGVPSSTWESVAASRSRALLSRVSWPARFAGRQSTRRSPAPTSSGTPRPAAWGGSRGHRAGRGGSPR